MNRLYRLLCGVVLTAVLPAILNAQPTPMSMTNATLGVSQNFNSVTNNALPTGFGLTTTAQNFADYSSATSTTTQGQATNLTSSSTGGSYFFNSSGDRALGYLSTSTFSSARGIVFGFTNNTGQTLIDLAVRFDYEKYRSGMRAFDMAFFTSTTGGSNNWTNVSNGSQSYIADSDNNAAFFPPSVVSKSLTLPGVNLAPSSKYYMLWTYTGSGGNDNAQALAIDNLSITPVPEPTAILAVAVAALGGPRLRRRLARA